jgi:hypothetical protein
LSSRRLLPLVASLALIASQAFADPAAEQPGAAPAKSSETAPMQRYIIEREIPGAGRMTAEQLREAAAKSNKVLHFMGPDIQWVQSYVTDNKLYCVYNARSADLIKQHAERSGFPANKITPVAVVIDPTTASSPVK